MLRYNFAGKIKKTPRAIWLGWSTHFLWGHSIQTHNNCIGLFDDIRCMWTSFDYLFNTDWKLSIKKFNARFYHDLQNKQVAEKKANSSIFPTVFILWCLQRPLHAQTSQAEVCSSNYRLTLWKVRIGPMKFRLSLVPFFPRNLQKDPLFTDKSTRVCNLLRGPLVRSHSFFDGLFYFLAVDICPCLFCPMIFWQVLGLACLDVFPHNLPGFCRCFPVLAEFTSFKHYTLFWRQITQNSNLAICNKKNMVVPRHPWLKDILHKITCLCQIIYVDK